MRKTKFITEEYYHIYNRGVDKRDVFMDDNDFYRFLLTIKELNRSEQVGSIYLQQRDAFRHPVSKEDKLVEFVAYSLLPNHYHFLLRQIVDDGIPKFMHKVSMAYSKFFNNKNKRSGSLFQGPYKSVFVDSENYLNYVSAYINGNSEIHLIKKADEYIWSSYQDYLGKRNGTICNKELISKDLKDNIKYKAYVNEVIQNASERKKDIKKFLLEE